MKIKKKKKKRWTKLLGSGVVVPSCRSVRRPYSRSKMARLRWTPQLHLCFLRAVERLGGQDRATPRLVLQLMNIKGISIAHVKSHLQMYRSKKINDTNLEMPEQGLSLESGAHNFYFPSQFPKLHSFNQRSLSSLSYGDACTWRGHDNQICSLYNSTIDRCGLNRAKHGLYGSITERVLFGRLKNNSFNGDSHLNTTISSLNNKRRSSRGTHPTILLDGGVESFQRCSRKPISGDQLMNNGSCDRNCRAIQEDENTAKRKTLDLNLSLRVNEKGMEGTSDQEEEEEDVVDSDLCLSLSSSSLSTTKHARKTKVVLPSTLDLTL
ncbi:two-component response regulator ARR2-like isoform X2 [Tripterygium wilfordii]|uniref:two-component response regulator ARR2-like isoform X2 n=1 Tax=Tripterygium wilfordii TaxID=458696 RepID=UPI0018F8642F|nr:two-component response regulator ARR2-like isoform X2 [Tripterygium wilfordii]